MLHTRLTSQKVINKIGTVECREQWGQGCNAPIKSHQGTGKRWQEGVCVLGVTGTE